MGNIEITTAMDKIKILIIAGRMNMGGIENQLMHLLRQADKTKFQIDFTTTAEHPFFEDEIVSLGGKCIHIPPTEGKHFFRYCRAIYHVMRDGQYDIVHSHELFHSGMVLLTARLAGVKHRIVHAHNWADGDSLKQKPSLKRRLYNDVMRYLIQKNATEFVACSALAGKFLYGEKITRRDNYHVIFNSVDTSKFLAQYDKAETGEFAGDGWVNVIQVGRFSAVKNQLFTAQIAAELKRRGKKIRILCAGNDGNEYEQEVRSVIEEQGLQDYMLLLGIRNDIDSLMRKSSAFLLPSQYEGMPLVLIEAQTSGLPCVAADTFSHEVDFNIGLVNWLSIDDDCKAWADAIESAVQQERAAKDDVCAAVTKYGFDSKIFAQKICNLYVLDYEGKG